MTARKGSRIYFQAKRRFLGYLQVNGQPTLKASNICSRWMLNLVHVQGRRKLNCFIMSLPAFQWYLGFHEASNNLPDEDTF